MKIKFVVFLILFGSFKVIAQDAGVKIECQKKRVPGPRPPESYLHKNQGIVRFDYEKNDGKSKSVVFVLVDTYKSNPTDEELFISSKEGKKPGYRLIKKSIASGTVLPGPVVDKLFNESCENLGPVE